MIDDQVLVLGLCSFVLHFGQFVHLVNVKVNMWGHPYPTSMQYRVLSER